MQQIGARHLIKRADRPVDCGLKLLLYGCTAQVGDQAKAALTRAAVTLSRF